MFHLKLHRRNQHKAGLGALAAVIPLAMSFTMEVGSAAAAIRGSGAFKFHSELSGPWGVAIAKSATSRETAEDGADLIRGINRASVAQGTRCLWLDRYGSFANLEEANNFVNATLSHSRPIVDEVIAGKRRSATVDSWFDKPTGREAYRRRDQDAPAIRQTFGARVVIRHDARRERGFSVVTAYPINSREGDAKSPRIPEAFDRLMSGFYVGAAEDFPSEEAIVDEALAGLLQDERDAAKSYLDNLLSGKYSEKELQAMWRSSRADIRPFSGDVGSCKEFLRFIRSRFDTFGPTRKD